jgi:hypothetical protein
MVRWEYLVEDIYEDSDFMPPKVPPGRLMTVDERAESYRLFTVGKKIETAWPLTKYLQARGKQGWELLQAQRLVTGNEYEPGYWKCFFKRALGD